ncbi:MAG: DUF2520 domain-containing protein [Desulfuromusa sp.]|nr:DUF2520 domain-containing protein [Desulfuromusa sp.]
MKQSVALIGPGRVGCSFSKRLYEAGYPITAIISREQQRAAEACAYIGCPTELAADQLVDATTAQIILLAVPDDQIQNLALQLQEIGSLSEQTTLIHFSGLQPAEIMRHSSSPAAVLSLHPLLPFADRQTAFTNLYQCPCALEGDTPPALTLGQELVNALGGQSFIIESDKKALYHAAACIASNYLVTLLASSRDLLVNCGIEADQAIPLLLPLVQASLNNVKDLGTEQGLTGPIVRGDIGTVTEHIEALKNNAPELLSLYLQMGRQTTTIASKSDRLEPKRVIAIHNLFIENVKNSIDHQNSASLSEKNN